MYRENSSEKRDGFKERRKRYGSEPKTFREDILAGKNAVYEAVSGGREIDKILFSPGSLSSVGHIVALARKKGILAQECDKRNLDSIYPDAHQGIIAFCSAVKYCTVDDILAAAESRGEPPIVMVCDGITDPHNLGAIIRSAEISGAHGVIIPRKKSAGLNSACAKAAAGALEHLPVCKASSTLAAVSELKEKGLSVFSADGGGTVDMYSADFKKPCAIVIGSEGNGISPEVKKLSDAVVSIPQKGQIPSLNASNAAAVLLYEVLRQRR